MFSKFTTGMEREGEDDVVCLDESFFINDNYQLTTFTFGSQVLELYCLQAASTDFDLTGQLVWPGAVLLNEYLSKNADILRGRSAIELGSGVAEEDFVVKDFLRSLILRNNISIGKRLLHFRGKNKAFGLINENSIFASRGITGVLCSRICDKIVMTDHNEEVLKILKKNIQLCKSTLNCNGCAGLHAEKLEWGNSDQLNYILQENPQGFDIVLGADICFQQYSIPLLFDTVKRLLVHGEAKSKFILAYVSRAKVIDALVVSEAVLHGLQINEIPGTRSIVKNIEGVIFEIILR